MSYYERMCELENLQRSYGMEPRKDSYLSKMYANNETDLSALDVVKELISVDYIYKNTLYGETIEDYMRELAQLIKENYKLSWNQTWEIVKFYGPDSLKLMSIISTNTSIPPIVKKN